MLSEERQSEGAPADVAVRKFPCPQCGAEIVWHPGAAKLACAYCGYQRAAENAGAQPLADRTLAGELKLEKRIGWGTERRAYRCPKCGAVETLEPGVAAGACAFCGTAAVVEAASDPDLVRPEGVLPFRLARNDAAARFRSWLGSLWFRPNDLKKHAELESFRGVYVPFWTFDAQTLSRWTAEAGYHRGTGKNRRTEWRPASGTLEHDFDDLPVPASRGLDGGLARELEPFPTGEMLPYDPDYLAGFLAEEYGVGLEDAHRAARERMKATLYSACRAEVPGDTCRNLRVTTQYAAEKFKAGLLPVWIAAYQYRGKSFAYAVNGATGKAAGTAPWSWAKIGLAALAALVVLLLVASAN